jgi:lysophospholipase L1-like esterase
MRALLRPRLPRSVLVPLLVLVALGPGCQGSSPSQPGTAAVVYAAIGASDALGVGAFPPSRGYVFQLADRMGGVAADVRLHNLGVSGVRIDRYLSEMLPQAIALDPTVVTVWAGPNDLIGGTDPTQFGLALDQLVAELRARTRALVFVGDVPDLTRAPLFQFDPDPDVTAPRIAAFNARIRSVAAARGAVLVGLSALPTDGDMFSIDGFHPSNRGHTMIADFFWAEIRPRL